MVGRNDPCPCGSGKKYKKCHMNSDQNSAKKSPKKKSLIKSEEEIRGMRLAGAFNGRLMDYIRPYVKAGISTEKINTLVHNFTTEHGHIPACLNYHKYPKSVCISINNVVCHGIPSPDEILQEGDIVNVDLTTIVNGFYGDSSETFFIGEVSKEAKLVTATSANALLKAIAAVEPGKDLNIVSDIIQPYVHSKNCSIVRQYTGHGIGREFHEHFSVCHHRAVDNDNPLLRPGMTFTIEPMINLGKYKVTTDRKDGWTVRTKDGSLSAQFEHTLLVTETGCDVLTLTPSQIAAGTLLNPPV